MKKYNKPELVVEEIYVTDVIASSFTSDGADDLQYRDIDIKLF